ncbi:hypothetical protein IFM58399_06111 [Aspergillus lentulus]|uniref:uncharacterized protein n=1 Tax=Aspergillus lentulus TaxID=293939 RepID=UPI0013956057|nr:uncharacterized protein IFM58399_06111 [Aspergillus lentulus]GFF40986.1 hypothetical protein IFM58399_06111 [Aspergillus lentulus]
MQQIRVHLRQVDKEILDLNERELNEVRSWIAGPETETEHNSICHDRKQYPSSGDWILDEAKVKTGYLRMDHRASRDRKNLSGVSLD